MTWFWVLLTVTIIGAIVGYFISGGEKSGAVAGGCTAGAGCGYILFRLFLIAAVIMIIFALARWLFGF